MQKNNIAEIQVSYRSLVPRKERVKIKCAEDAFELLRGLWDSDLIEYKEDFKMLLLNRANEVFGVYHVSSGGTTGTIVDPKIVLGVAIKANACAIILAHNHPSGNLRPSQADIDITRKLSQGGKLLDMRVLDHLILTKDSWFSFADEGLLL